VIAHDDPASFAANHDEGLATRGRYRAIVQSAQQVWCASPQLAKLYQLRDEARATLPPIPDGFDATPAWKPEFANSPLLVYAGNYWPAQLPLLARIAFQLAKIGGRLMLVVKGSSEIEALCSEAPVLWREPFAENRQALRFLADSAAGLLVSYSETSDSMPWIRTSFPSKLIEYTHLGLPIMIYAPEDSAVADWARSRAYPDYATPQIADAITEFVESLKIVALWRKKAAISRRFAVTEFDPHRIQKIFEEGLTRGALHYEQDQLARSPNIVGCGRLATCAALKALNFATVCESQCWWIHRSRISIVLLRNFGQTMHGDRDAGVMERNLVIVAFRATQADHL
jgi:hypothetical protein